jgi:uncharacterized protein YlzI (FlbEa/FlbD family)
VQTKTDPGRRTGLSLLEDGIIAPVTQKDAAASMPGVVAAFKEMRTLVESGKMRDIYPRTMKGFWAGEISEQKVALTINEECDFLGIPAMASRSTQRMDPDVTLTLPNGKKIIIEVKCRPVGGAIEKFGTGVGVRKIDNAVRKEEKTGIATVIVLTGYRGKNSQRGSAEFHYGCDTEISAIDIYGWLWADDYHNYGWVEETNSASHSQSNYIVEWADVRLMSDFMDEFVAKNIPVN